MKLRGLRVVAACDKLLCLPLGEGVVGRASQRCGEGRSGVGRSAWLDVRSGKTGNAAVPKVVVLEQVASRSLGRHQTRGSGGLHLSCPDVAQPCARIPTTKHMARESTDRITSTFQCYSPNYFRPRPFLALLLTLFLAFGFPARKLSSDAPSCTLFDLAPRANVGLKSSTL